MTPVLWVLLFFFLLTALMTAYLTFLVVREYVIDRHPASQLDALEVEQSGENVRQAAPKVSVGLNTPLQDAGGPPPKVWDGGSRITILFMGLDYRDWEEETDASRTDTMMLFTVDPVSQTGGILAIPRDLWVNIPGYEYGKINTAYYLGEVYDLPGGGPGLAIQTVEQLLGVTINYYAQLDFAAFERMVDEIGGVELDILEEISVDPIGPGNTVVLQPGVQTLDGQVALAYARNRDTAGGDFDRSQRQQQVIMAIRKRILDLNMLPTLISKSPVLYQELSEGIRTNLTLEEIVKLSWLAAQIPEQNVKRAAIGTDQVTITVSPDGLDILLPDPDKVRALRDDLFVAAMTAQPVAVAGNPEELMKTENASIAVLNATYTVGLAAETMEYLRTKGLNITSVGNAQEVSANTTIIDYSGKPHTVQYLVTLLNIQSNRIFSRFDPNSEVDIAVMLGEDWSQNNPMP